MMYSIYNYMQEISYINLQTLNPAQKQIHVYLLDDAATLQIYSINGH